MNRIDRLSAILIMLQSHKLITAQEISERFDISLRTVYRDMKALDEAGVPIGAEAGRGYYLVEGYHLPPVMFTPEEAGAMLIAEKLIEKFSDQSVKTYFGLAIDKIKAVLPEEQLDFVDNMHKNVHVFFNPLPVKEDCPNNNMTIVQQALSDGNCLTVKYFSHYRSASTSRIIEPLSLCFYSFQWHLIAFCKFRNDYRDFRLDRFQEVEITSQKIEHNAGFSIHEYFNKIQSDNDVFSVSILFDKEKSATISQTRYYFGFYEEKERDGYMEMRFAVHEYGYIASWLMGLGNLVIEVPDRKLKEVIRNKTELLVEKYRIGS